MPLVTPSVIVAGGSASRGNDRSKKRAHGELRPTIIHPATSENAPRIATGNAMIQSGACPFVCPCGSLCACAITEEPADAFSSTIPTCSGFISPRYAPKNVTMKSAEHVVGVMPAVMSPTAHIHGYPCSSAP